MPSSDISKCEGQSCPVKESCWRYVCPADPLRQSYIEFEYKDGKCEGYWEIK